jgi:hypothetical protein
MKKFKELVTEIKKVSSPLERFDGRRELVAHMKKLGKQQSYENQRGAHVYWFHNKEKTTDIHAHVKKLDSSAKYDKEFKETSGDHKGQSYSVDKNDEGAIHLRLYKSGVKGAKDRAGKDVDESLSESSNSLDKLVDHIGKIGKQTSHETLGKTGHIYHFKRDNNMKAHIVHDHVAKLDSSAKFDADYGETQGKYKGYHYNVSTSPKSIILQVG